MRSDRPAHSAQRGVTIIGVPFAVGINAHFFPQVRAPGPEASSVRLPSPRLVV